MTPATTARTKYSANGPSKMKNLAGITMIRAYLEIYMSGTDHKTISQAIYISISVDGLTVGN